MAVRPAAPPARTGGIDGLHDRGPHLPVQVRRLLGAARRSEFWYFFLFTFLVGIVTTTLDAVLGTDFETGGGVVNTLGSLVLLLPSLAVAVRRMHDTDRSGWWLLIGIIPIVGWILLIVWYCADTKPGDNQYGPDPKHGPSGGYQPPAAPYGSGQYGG